MANIEEAVRRFLEGEEEAFGRITRQWEKKIYSLAWRMLGNREDAQDVVQDTFLSVFRHMKGLRDPARFSVWIYRIALNHCRLRMRSNPSHISLDAGASDPSFKANEDYPDALASSRAGDAVEAADIIRKALAGLSENHRTALILKEYIGLSLEELAAVMNCPLSTAKSRVYQGLRQVQKNLIRLGVKLDEP